MVTELQFGLALTGLAWLGLVIVVIHARYVIQKIATGEYRKGPFREDSGGENR